MTSKQITTLAVAAIVMTGSALAADLGPVSVHGTFSQGYINSTDNNYIEDSEGGTFDVREYGLNAMWQTPLEKLRVGAQVFGREYGAVGNDQIYLDWAYADYRQFDWLGFRAGRVKVPMGFYNETRDVDALRTQVLLPQSVYTELSREIVDNADGGSLYGDIAMGASGGLSYELVYGVSSLDEDDGDMSRIMTSSGLPPDNYDEKPGYAGAIEWRTPVDGLRVGTSYSRWKFNMDSTSMFPGMPPMPAQFKTDPMEIATISAEYTIGNLMLSTEGAQMDVDGDTIIAPGTPYAQTQPYDQKFRGGYLSADYRFFSWLESALGYSYMQGYGSTDATSKDLFVSVRFDICKNVILKLEEHFIDGVMDVFPKENPDGIEDDMTVFMAKATVYF